MPSDKPTDNFADQPTEHRESAGSSKSADLPSAPSLYEVDHKESAFAQTEFLEFDFDNESMPTQISKYRLLECVGKGGSGSVYRAESVEDQSIVAVKILRPDVIASRIAVQRFEKEARMQSEVHSPYVTRLLEFGNQRGLHYIISEFVDGISLRRLCDILPHQDRKFSLVIIRDVLRALNAMHTQGLVHRDVKPENVLVMFDESAGTPDPATVKFKEFKIAKLTDFGLARQIEQSESLAMTQQKAVLGTPVYLAPEQYAESRLVDARADIYSLGATLYHLLAGVPPFVSDEFMELAELHRTERPRPLNSLNSEIGDAISNVVAKALEKLPDLRYSDAGEMLADIENVLAGKPVSIRVYPATPDAADAKVKKYEFAWELAATAQDLWPLVSDTDRFNRAMGLPAPKYVHQTVSDSKTETGQDSQRDRTLQASARFNGIAVSWTEHAFQWIEGREMSVLREFHTGPFEWYTSTVELFPLASCRTRLVHRIQVKPRGWLGKLITPIQFGWVTQKQLSKVYRRIAELAQDRNDPVVCDLPFGKPVALRSAQSKRLDEKIEQLQKKSPPELAEKLGQYVRSAADANVSRMRPKPLARSFKSDPEEFTNLCLDATRAGILSLMWDLICPICRIAADSKNSLKAIAEHGHCEACQSDFEIDFRKTVELVFRVHPDIRQTDTQTYCIGGPYHSPHVIAQNRLQPGDRVTVGTRLDEGLYQIRGPQLPDNQMLGVKQDAVLSRCQIDLLHPIPKPELAIGAVCIELRNPSEQELVARIERLAERTEATTAAEVSQMPRFQNMFPEEVVSAEQLINLTTANVLMIKLIDFEEVIDEVGEIRSRNLRQSLVDFLKSDDPSRPIESSSEQLEIVFDKQTEALAAMLSCYQWRSDSLSAAPDTQLLKFGFAINSGEVLIGGSKSEYFGKMVRVGRKLIKHTGLNELVVTKQFSENDQFLAFAESELERSDDLTLDDETEFRKFSISV